MRKAARSLLLSLMLAAGLVWAHGTYVETQYVERYALGTSGATSIPLRRTARAASKSSTSTITTGTCTTTTAFTTAGAAATSKRVVDG